MGGRITCAVIATLLLSTNSVSEVFAGKLDVEGLPTVTIDQALARELSRQVPVNVLPQAAADWQRGIDQPLRRAWQEYRSGRDVGAGFSSLADELIDGDRVLVEIVYDAAARQQAHDELRLFGATITHDITRGNWLEAWLPLSVLPEIARVNGVLSIRAARLLELDGGDTTTEGLAAGQAMPWHAAGLDGSGFTIAIMDRFGDTGGEIADLQQSGDWPPNSQVDMVKVGMTCGTSFGACGISHGNAVLEIAYDIAPGANFIAYDIATAADWINATDMAINAGAHILSASMSAPLDGIGDGTALPGSVAEAQLDAVDSNRVVITSGGNERQRHWGGVYSGLDIGDADYADAHQWVDDITLNFIGTGPGSIFCISNETSTGQQIRVSANLSWNDWDDVDNDYVLALYRIDGADEITRMALSERTQNGGPGQTPQEWITADTHTDVGWDACPEDDQAGYGWRIYRRSADGSHNFRFFSNMLEYQVHESSLTYPGDAIGVLSVAAISTNDGHASFSSEGPILAPGGGVPTGSEHPQPSLASFFNVATSSISGFGGTSAAAPHVAGMAALLWHRHSSFVFFPAEEIANRLKNISVTGSNDLGALGHDFQHGWGRLRFQLEDQAQFIIQPTDTVVGELMSPNPTIEILDDEGLRIISGPTRTFDLTFGNDPSGGSATLLPPLIWHVLDGLAPFGGLHVDTMGEGYTLAASSGDFSLETNAFDIVPATDLAIANGIGIAGGEVNLPFIVNGNAIGAVGFQFDAVIDPDVLELRDGGDACGFLDLVGALPDHNVSCNDVETNVLRVLVVSDFSGPIVPFPEGELFELRLSVLPDVADGETGLVAFTNVVVSDEVGNEIDSDTIILSHGLVEVGAEPEFEITPSAIDFGVVDPSFVPVTQSAEITNAGDPGSTLTVSLLQLMSEESFEIASDNCQGQTLSAGESCQVEVALTTTMLGNHSTSLSVLISDDGNRSVYTVPVTAEVVELEDELFSDRFENAQ